MRSTACGPSAGCPSAADTAPEAVSALPPRHQRASPLGGWSAVLQRLHAVAVSTRGAVAGNTAPACRVRRRRRGIAAGVRFNPLCHTKIPWVRNVDDSTQTAHAAKRCEAGARVQPASSRRRRREGHVRPVPPAPSLDACYRCWLGGAAARRAVAGLAGRAPVGRHGRQQRCERGGARHRHVEDQKGTGASAPCLAAPSSHLSPECGACMWLFVALAYVAPLCSEQTRRRTAPKRGFPDCSPCGVVNHPLLPAALTR